MDYFILWDLSSCTARLECLDLLASLEFLDILELLDIRGDDLEFISSLTLSELAFAHPRTPPIREGTRHLK